MRAGSPVTDFNHGVSLVWSAPRQIPLPLRPIPLRLLVELFLLLKLDDIFCQTIKVAVMPTQIRGFSMTTIGKTDIAIVDDNNARRDSLLRKDTTLQVCVIVGHKDSTTLVAFDYIKFHLFLLISEPTTTGPAFGDRKGGHTQILRTATAHWTALHPVVGSWSKPAVVRPVGLYDLS